MFREEPIVVIFKGQVQVSRCLGNLLSRVYALLKFICIIEPGRDGIAVENSSFECIDSLSQLAYSIVKVYIETKNPPEEPTIDW